MTIANIQKIKMTAEQYFQLGEDPPGVRLELIDGEIIVSPSPSRKHAKIIRALNYLLETHLRQYDLGELYLDTDVIFAPDLVRRPDFSFFSTSLLSTLSNDYLDAPPDLCIEILSPGSGKDDRVNKFNLYESSGVNHYWIIDPATRTAECFALKGATYELINTGTATQTVTFAPFNTLQMPLADLWN